MFEGKLKQIPLSELFGMIAGGHKSGLLKLYCEENESHIYFEDGLITYARILEGANLGEYLMRMELLTSLQVQQLVALQAKENPHTMLGLLAYRRNLILESQLIDALSAQVSDTITEVLGWSNNARAGFTFQETGGESSQVPTEHRFNPQTVIFEAAKRIDEWSRGQVQPWQVLRPLDTDFDLSLEEWEMLSLINGQRSCASIATEFDLPEGEVYRRLYILLEKGAAELLSVQPEDPYILLISGSATLRRLGALMLTRARYRIVTANTLEKAKDIIQNTFVSAAILDSENPTEDANNLRSIKGRGHLMVLVLTNQKPTLRSRLARLRYLPKPLDEDVLLQALSQVVKRPT